MSAVAVGILSRVYKQREAARELADKNTINKQDTCGYAYLLQPCIYTTNNVTCGV